MKKSIILLVMLACVALFAVPVFAADAEPATATLVTQPAQVTTEAEAASTEVPVQLSAEEMATVTGEHGWILGSFRLKYQAIACATFYIALWNWYTVPGTDHGIHLDYKNSRWEVHAIPFGGGSPIKA